MKYLTMKSLIVIWTICGVNAYSMGTKGGEIQMEQSIKY